MAMKAKHAFGALENIDAALANGTIDNYDILFVKDSNGKPYVGWIDKDGNKVVCDDSAEFAELKSQIATKANTEEVDVKISSAATDSVTTAKSYTDEQIASAVSEHLVKKYEISHKPDGTIVNYRDKEIRVLCPADTIWTLQNSGQGADKNAYYIGFKAFAPDAAVSFKEDLAETIADDEMYYFEGNDFAGTDKNGRKYSIVWLPVARYDESTSTWTYSGANSTEDKYLGWYYSVEFYDANGRVIASDCIRINLSNEDCHSNIKPYYGASETVEIEGKVEEVVEEKMTTKVEEAVTSANAYTDKKIAEIAEASSYEIIEF